jgi:putative solute:sodium symporter small subunit
MQLTERHLAYWRALLKKTAWLLAIWFLITYVVGFYAEALSFNFFGWPFSFWVGAQGALIVYVGIIWYYARTMNRMDDEFGVAEPEED